MKHFKKGLLGVMVITAMTLMAAEDRTIHVNTFEDEDNVNMNQCSLREAIKTASLNKAYGGCSAGNTGSGQTDYIQLEAGTYKLNKEIVPESKVIGIYTISELCVKLKSMLFNLTSLVWISVLSNVITAL